MKKNLLFVMLGLFACLVSCQKEPFSSSGSESVSTLTVTIPQGISTRAAADYGQGTYINRCILEIYHNGTLYGERKVQSVSGNQVVFSDLQLIPSKTYDFVLWADCGDGLSDKYYNTSKLESVTYSDGYDYSGNNDEYDAFSYCLSNYEVTGSFSESIKFTRPFGQLNIKTYDLQEIDHETLKPSHVQISFASVPTSFNVFTGEVGNYQSLTYGSPVEIEDVALGELTVDYIFAVPEQSELSDFTMTFYKGSTPVTINDNFRNIPIRRNYRTNVSGNLITKKGELNVTINKDFINSGDDEPIVVAASIAEANTALSNGATNVVLSNAPDAPSELRIAKVYADPDATVSITLPATTQPITLTYDDGSQNVPAVVNLISPSSEEINIDLENSKVVLDGQTYNVVTSITSADALIVSEDVTIQSLTVQKGNVEIYGKVDNPIDFEDGSGIVNVYNVADAASLSAAAQLVSDKKCAKIVMTSDIDLQGSVDNMWDPINTENSVFEEFDGGGYTLSNLYVDNMTGHSDGVGYYYGGLFYVLQGAVKNLTIDNATVTCFRGGSLVGRMDYGTVENCYVKNITINGFQKVSGLVGFISDHSKDISIIGCTVENCAINTVAPEQGLYQAGGLIGYLQSFDRNVLVEGCSVSDISFDKVYESADDVADKVYDMEQYYSHAFIGTIANVSNTVDAYDKYTIELRNNSVAQQIAGIPTCDRTDDYIGWWAGDYNTGRPYSTKLVVDGVAKDRWIEVKRLATQIAAGGDVNVWRTYDLTKCPDTQQEIAITVPTVLNLKGGTLTVGKQQIVNKSELTVNGPGAMSATDYIFMNESDATLTINGGTFTSTNATDANGVVIYNQGVCNIKNGTFDAPGFTLMNTGNADMTIDGGNIVNRGSVTGYALMAYGSSAQLTVNGGKIDAMQSMGGANVLITGGTIYNDSRYYALYNEGGQTTITGGYFSGYTDMKDIYIAGGTVNIQGGYFQDNEAVPSAGYIYIDNVQEVDGITYNYEVVPQ